MSAGRRRLLTNNEFVNTIKMTLTTEGNLGVGTINPKYKIVANGLIQANSNFNPKSSITINSIPINVGFSAWRSNTQLITGITNDSSNRGVIQVLSGSTIDGTLPPSPTPHDLHIQPSGGLLYLSNNSHASLSRIIIGNDVFGSAKLIVTPSSGNASFFGTTNSLYVSSFVQNVTINNPNQLDVIHATFTLTGSGSIDTNNYFLKCLVGNTTQGGIKYNNPGVALHTISDLKLKKNIKPIESSLSKILKLNPVNFDWIENGKNSNGLIAQEVKEILPDLVTETNLYNDKDEKILMLDYIGFIPFLIGAIKEQQQIIDDLKNKINKLENNLKEK